MSGEGNIDEIFKSKLGNLNLAPSEDVWNRIESDLDNGPKGGGYYKWGVLLLLLIGIGWATWYAVGDQEIKANNALTEKQAEVLSPSEEKTSDTDLVNTSSNKDIRVSNMGKAKQGQANNQNKEESPTSTEASQNTDKNLKPSKPSLAQRVNMDARPASSGDKQENAQSSGAQTNGKITTGMAGNIKNVEAAASPSLNSPQTANEDYTSLTAPEPQSNDLRIGLMNLKTVDFVRLNPELSLDTDPIKIRNEKPQWAIGAYYEANWHYKVIETTQGKIATVDSIRSRESDTFSSGFGINVQFQTVKGFRFSTGIEYGSWCHAASYPISIEPNEYASVFNPGDSYNGQLVGASGNQVIEVDNAELDLTESFPMAPEPIEFKLDLHQCYKYIAVPIRFSYALNLGAWDVVPEIGAAYNRIIEHDIRSDSSKKLNTLSLRSTNDYNKNIFVLSGSLGIERQLNQSFKIGAQGMYSRWITPIYSDNAFETHPYILSARLGIWYTF